jgi:hypothetical protein
VNLRPGRIDSDIRDAGGMVRCVGNHGFSSSGRTDELVERFACVAVAKFCLENVLEANVRTTCEGRTAVEMGGFLRIPTGQSAA